MGAEIALASLVSVIAGLDRTALLQVMLFRPLVVGPLTGCLLGVPQEGLQIGFMGELLWLGRLPVGAAVPPDDTQVSIGATTLAAIYVVGGGNPGGLPIALVCLLLTMPLGVFGQLLDRLARERNQRLVQSWDRALEVGQLERLERLHLTGLVHFGLASLGSFLVVLLGGWPLLHWFGTDLVGLLEPMAEWLRLGLLLVGSAAILGHLNVSRSLTLFSAAFVMVMLLLWLT